MNDFIINNISIAFALIFGQLFYIFYLIDKKDRKISAAISNILASIWIISMCLPKEEPKDSNKTLTEENTGKSTENTTFTK